MSKNKQPAPSFEDRLLRATAETAVAAAREAGVRAEQLIDAWVAAANAEAVLEVSERGEGVARKAARRGLNILRARRVAIPKLRRVAALSPEKAAEVVEGWMMAPDSTGMQLFAVTSRAPSGRYRAAFVFLHATQGVARVDNATMSQTQLKEYFAKLLPGAGYGPTPVPLDWARFRIADARRAHKARGLPEPLGFTTAAPLIEAAPDTSPTHPFDEEGFELADEDAIELAKGSGALHNVPEFRNWLPSNAAMQELLVKVGEKLNPGETPEPGVVTDHLRAEADAATDRYFTPDVRDELLRSMKDAALSALARDGEQRALEIAAVMKVIAQCGLVTNPPREVPFLKAFFDKAVALMIAQGGGRLRIPVANPALSGGEPAFAPAQGA